MIHDNGTTEDKDITVLDIKRRFQHELDLWLKKTYLRKEWRSAEFADGALQKKNPAPSR